MRHHRPAFERKTTIFIYSHGMQARTSDFFTGKTSTKRAALIPTSGSIILSHVQAQKDYLCQVINRCCRDWLRLQPGRGSGNEFCLHRKLISGPVARAFENDEISMRDSIDIMPISQPLIWSAVSRSAIIENRLAAQRGPRRKPSNPLELPTLAKCQEFLLTEKPLKLLELSAEERESVKHIPFLTDKPLLIIINVDEKQQAAGDYPGRAAVEQYCAEQGYEWLSVCAKTEVEIAQLPPEDGHCSSRLG